MTALPQSMSVTSSPSDRSRASSWSSQMSCRHASPPDACSPLQLELQVQARWRPMLPLALSPGPGKVTGPGSLTCKLYTSYGRDEP